MGTMRLRCRRRKTASTSCEGAAARGVRASHMQPRTLRDKRVSDACSRRACGVASAGSLAESCALRLPKAASTRCRLCRHRSTPLREQRRPGAGGGACRRPAPGKSEGPKSAASRLRDTGRVACVRACAAPWLRSAPALARRRFPAEASRHQCLAVATPRRRALRRPSRAPPRAPRNGACAAPCRRAAWHERSAAESRA